MKTPLNKLVFLSLLLSLLASGCAVLQQDAGHGPDTDAVIEKMIAEQEYGKALKLLDSLEEKESSTYSSRKKELDTLINKLEESTVVQAGDKAGREDLLDAITLIDNTLKKIPARPPLVELRKKLVRERELKKEETSTHLLLLEAGYLLDRLTLYERQAQFNKPSIISRWQMDKMKSSLEGLRSGFLNCENVQNERGNTTLAEKCTQMAERIKPDNSRKNLGSIEQKESARPEELSAGKKKRPAAMATTTTTKPLSNTAPEQDTRPSGKSGQQTDANNMKTPEDISKLLIEQYMREGATLYRAGKIHEARDTWKKVLAINEEHPAALEQVSRAEKVIQHLDNLKKTSQTPEIKK